MNFQAMLFAIFDNLSKFAMLIFVYEFSRIFSEKYRTKLSYLGSIGLALVVSLLGYNGYSKYPQDLEYATIIFVTILIPSLAGIYMGRRIKPETLDRLIYTRRYFPEYRLLSDQEIVGIFRELYPKLTEMTDDEIIGGLESKYSSAPLKLNENDLFSLLPNTRKKCPEYKNLTDKHIVAVFKEKQPELKDSLDIAVIIQLEKQFGDSSLTGPANSNVKSTIALEKSLQ